MDRAVSRRRPAPLVYRVSMPEPMSHELHVTLAIPAMPERSSVVLAFAAWAPGSYMVRDFARHIYDLVATGAEGRRLPVERLDKQRWRVRSEGRRVRVSYRVFAFEQSVRTSFLDDSHAYWNGTSVFFAVEGEGGRPCRIEVDPPRGWHVSTPLSRARARNVFAAAGYDELVDSPFEVGTHRRATFSVRGARFEVALYGRTNAELPRLLADLKRIVAAAAAIFGGFPFDSYLFIIHALPARGGGLEHACASTLHIAGLSFEDEKGYQGFAELAAHEFFHVWNVKRIRDRVLGPFDYARENYTRLLWLHEGFTDHMESVILLRARLLDPKKYLRDLAEGWSRYVARPGRNVTPLSELSFEAWIKQYKPAENYTNRAVSYYEKGKWAGLVLDLVLRDATGGRRGLPDFFRRLWRDFGQLGRGITEEDVRKAAARVAGRSMNRFFARYIDGVAELPVPSALRRAGVSARGRVPWADEEDATKARRARGWSGLAFASASASGGERPVVRNVVPGSPAWRAGITYGDELVAVNEHKVTSGNVGRRLADGRPGQPLRVAFFRREELCTVSLVLAESPERAWVFEVDSAATAHARAVRRGWWRG